MGFNSGFKGLMWNLYDVFDIIQAKGSYRYDMKIMFIV